MISGIIKVEVNVISRSRRLPLITLIISDITQTESNNRFIIHRFKANNGANALSHRTQFIFDTPCSYFAVHELDIALENHALLAQPTDYSLICRYRLVNNL